MGVSLYGVGYTRTRVMSPVNFLQVATGLIWGAHFGYSLACSLAMTRANQALFKWLKLMNPLVVLTIVCGIVLGQGERIPGFATYAREWDARHQIILGLRDSGHRRAAVAPLNFDLSEYFLEQNLFVHTENSCAKLYYGLDAIVRADDS